MRKRVVIALVALALVLAGAGVLAWRFLDKTEYEQAVAWLPPETLRASYTDWSTVRSLASGRALDAGSSAGAVRDYLDRAYEQDLVSTSAVQGATQALATKYGASPLTASWEMFGQSREGAVSVLQVDSVAGVEQNLRRLGYDAPADGADTGGVWAGSTDLVAQIDPTLSPVMENVVVLEEEKVVVMSDSPTYAESAADVVTGEEDGLREATDGVPTLADQAGTPVSAVLYASDFACEALGMADAGEEDQRLAERLVEDAGDLSPLSGLVLAHQKDRSLTVSMYFESSDQAADNLAPRVRLASGEAVGQGGSFGDRFRIASAEADGNSVVLVLEPAGEVRERAESALLSDLSQGPLLFATC